MSKKHFRFSCVLAWSVLLAGGCGFSEYEQLVKSRVEELKAANELGPVTWTPLQSATGFSVNWPEPAQLPASPAANGTSESLEATKGPIRFQAFFLDSRNPVSIQEVATAQEQNILGQGFVAAGRSEGKIESRNYIQLEFNKPDNSARTRMRIYQLSPQQSCVLSVTGKVLDDPQLDSFLESLKR